MGEHSAIATLRELQREAERTNGKIAEAMDAPVAALERWAETTPSFEDGRPVRVGDLFRDGDMVAECTGICLRDGFFELLYRIDRDTEEAVAYDCGEAVGCARDSFEKIVSDAMRAVSSEIPELVARCERVAER